ncbi:MAG TPA: hypothetical protein VFY71_10815 [Planctomycetota bacterium]|nr:hypothetical protein [Planctomycetota bacterium]
MPIVLALLAAFLMGLGLRALITRRPYVFPARWMFVFGLLAFAPNSLMPLLMRFPDHGRDSISDLFLTLGLPAMFVVLVIMLWLTMRGYMAMAITESSMREGLFAALAEMQLPHEETLGAIRLPSVPAELQVAVQSWIGTGQIKARSRGATKLVDSIARGMNAHFQRSAAAANLTCPVLYVIMSMLLFGVDVAMVVK